MKIVAVDSHDIRFPTSRELDGSDAMNPEVQHLSMFGYVAVSGDLTDRVIEYVDHFQEHFADPVVIENGAYRAPTAPGFSARMLAEPMARYAYPDGAAWR